MIDQELLIKSVSTQLDERERLELEAWLAISEENRTYYQRIKDEYIEGAESNDLDNVSVDQAYQQMFSKVKDSDKKGSLPLIYKWAAVISFCLVSIFVVDQILNSKKEPLQAAAPGTIDDLAYLEISNEDRVLLGNQTTISLDQTNVVIASTSNQVSYRPKNAIKSEVTNYHSLVVPRGGQFQVVLSDGSKVWLNADSKLTYPEVFGEEMRVVELSGEAYFEVIHDKDWPFQVKSGDQVISVLGTSFNVSAYPDEGYISTTLVDGSVKVDIENQGSFLLIPGTQLHYTDAVMQKEVDVKLYTGWKEGLFIFHEESLEVIMNKLSRWYNVDIEYRNESLKAEKINGEIAKFEHVQPIIDILSETGVASFKLENETILVY